MCSDAMLPENDHGTHEDEIVADVRATRNRLAAAVGYDFDRLWAQYEALESAERARGRAVLRLATKSDRHDYKAGPS